VIALPICKDAIYSPDLKDLITLFHGGLRQLTAMALYHHADAQEFEMSVDCDIDKLYERMINDRESAVYPKMQSLVSMYVPSGQYGGAVRCFYEQSVLHFRRQLGDSLLQALRHNGWREYLNGDHGKPDQLIIATV